jgi:flagellin-like protein
MRVWGDKNRGQSELIGTVLMVSITIVGAVLTIALAGGALQAINDETQDSLTRDAFYEMDNRLSGLQSSQVSSETTLRFPQGSGSDISVNESEGSVNITVRTADEYRQLTEDNVTHFNNTMGTVVYEGNDGEELVYQGGGLWEYPSVESTPLQGRSVCLVRVRQSQERDECNRG